MAPFSFRSLHEWFFNVILTSANSVPIQSLWVAFFTNPLALNRAFQAGLYENGFSYFSVAAGAATNTAQSGLGALFCNAIKIPGDGINVSKSGPEGSGMIKGNIGGGRKDMQNLSMSFLDTNQSFTDFNIRPWIIYAGHKSLKDAASKTTITIIQLAKTGSGKILSPRAIWTFMDAVPVNIETEDYDYGEDKVKFRTVEFAYNYYTLNANPLDVVSTVASVVKSFTDGNKSTTPAGKSLNSAAGQGLGSYGDPVNVAIKRNDKTSLDSHAPAQLIKVPKNDVVTNAVGVGLDILTGGGKFAGTNVTIKTDDTVDRLIMQGQQILQMAKVAPDDVPDHSGGEQTGYVGVDVPFDDHEIRNSIGNVAALQKELSRDQGGGYVVIDPNDTPLFSPGPRDTVADAQPKKVVGNTAGGETDTVVGLLVQSQHVALKNNDTVKGKNVISNLISVPVNPNIRVSSQEVSIERNPALKPGFEAVTVKRNGPIGNIPLQIVKINKEK